MSIDTADGAAAATTEPGALRMVRWLAILGAVLVGVVIVSSAWMRHDQAGLRCEDRRACYRPAETGAVPPGSSAVVESAVGESERAAGGESERAGVARLAHRISATAVTAAIAGVLLIGWAARPLPAGVVSSALALAALTLALAVVGTRGMQLKLPIVTLANLVGGMSMLAIFGRLLVRASAAGNAGAPRVMWWARLLVAALLAQITLGGLVSAHFAGLACAGDPWCGLAGGDAWSMASWSPMVAASDPVARSAAQGAAMAALQGTHRVAGVLVAALALAVAGLGRRTPAGRVACGALALLAVAQPLLGVAMATLELPHALVLAHNGGAALLLFVATTLAARPARAVLAA